MTATEPPASPARINYLLLVLANLFWAGNFIAGRLVVTEITPLQLTWTRWLIALIILIPLALRVDGRVWRAGLREWPLHVCLAVLGVIGFNLFSYVALQYTTSLDAAVVGSINPALIAVVAAIIIRERIKPLNVLGLAVSLLGVLLVLTDGNLLGTFTADYNLGELYMLGAVTVWTFYSILGRKLTTPPVTSTAIQAIMAVIILTPFIAVGGFDVSLSAGGWTGLLYIAVFPSVLSFMFWNIAVRRVGAARSGIFLNLLPVFTALLGLLMGNGISAVQLLGGGLVILGVSVTVRPPRRAIV
ncbi:DMT family transporter [Klugiella xanthotipulae]|uniref:Threonine/homoserine efflux transporter RhtA n=1 Tax=Klugiella xanthotipulae TaxID=244735 RepID=A0A543HXK4_9MICO|nr:DMT family transporter [Klugiella xanthotipulae]TQM63067.1 threonine/homoserine efflux transporter RhtA [Klugiella xanthotipulae]